MINKMKREPRNNIRSKWGPDKVLMEGPESEKSGKLFGKRLKIDSVDLVQEGDSSTAEWFQMQRINSLTICDHFI